MVRFTTIIDRFGEQGEKTGWTYIEISAAIAQKLKPGNKKSFRVKGMLDDYPIAHVALMPMGDGKFILPLNAEMRKGTGKKKGDKLKLQLEPDESEFKIPSDLAECFADEPAAKKVYDTYAKSHQRYFLNYIEGAKTDATRVKRIAHTVNALVKKMDFGQMVRALKAERDQLRQ